MASSPRIADDRPGSAVPRPRAGPPRWPARRLVAVVAGLLGLHVCLAFLGILNRSVTSDETGHLTAGYAYWKFNDYRLQPENGNLPQRWGALPLVAAPARFDRTTHPGDWEMSRVWNLAEGLLFEQGNDTDFLLLCARSCMLFWSVAAGGLVFWWARAIWGDAAGVGALALFAISPTTLAHGPLVTSDMCAAVCLLAAVAAWDRMCAHPGGRQLAIAGVATGLAFLAKFSAFLLLPVFVALGGLALAANAAAPPAARRPRLLRRLVGASGLAGLIAVGLIWLGFGLRYAGPNPGAGPFVQYYLGWDTVLPAGHAWTRLVQLARSARVLPEAFLYGFSFVAYFARERGAFLAGHYSVTGWWWFFPFAFLVKSTIGELLVAGMLGAGVIARWRSRCGLRLGSLLNSPVLPLLLFGAVFGVFALTSKLDIGQRHILPLYLVLFILAGALFSPAASRLVRSIAWVAVLASAAESLANQPNQLAFFNRLAGGPENGWRLLADSSLDWGQDVSALASWVRRHQQPGEPVYVSCFGTADPVYEGIRGELLSPYYTLGKPRFWYDLKPGLYCVSATMLQDVYGLRPGPWTADKERDFQTLKIAARVNLARGTWDRRIPELGFHPENPLWLLDRLRFARLCQYLKVRKPDAVINHTQFVYRLSAAEVAAVADGPFSALFRMMQQAADRR